MKKVVLILISLFLMVLAVGCGSKEPTAKVENKPEAPTTATGTHKVVDFKGKTVEVPNKIERIVVLGPLPLATVLTVFQGGDVSNIVGVAPDSVNGAKHTIFSRYAPDFTKISYDFYNGGQLNLEELIKLKPDVVFYMGAELADVLAQAKISAVEFSHPRSGGEASPLLTLKSWMDTIEQILQKKSPAQDIIAYGQEVEAEIKARVAAAPNAKVKKMLFLSNYSDTAIGTLGKKSFGQYWSELVGGENLGSRPTSGKVNMEQVYEWAPEQIFIMTFSDKSPTDLYNNTAAPGHDWSGIPAVTNKEVFKFPFGMHRWCPPTTDTPLAMWWVAKNARPELFEDIDLNVIIKDYYKKFYGMDLTDDDVQWILNPKPETKRMNM